MNDADAPDHTPVGKHFLVCCFTISERELELDNQSLQHDLNYVSRSVNFKLMHYSSEFCNFSLYLITIMPKLFSFL